MGPLDPQIAEPSALAERQHGVVERSQLRALGVSDTRIRGLIRARTLLRLHRGVYAVGHRSLRLEGRMLAAVLACGPGAVLSHRSAAALWELRATERDRIDVSAASRRGGADAAIDLHRTGGFDAVDVAVHRGVPVTSVARTFVDLAGVVAAPALERALAQAEVAGIYDRAALLEVLGRSNGRRGAGALRAALDEPFALTRSKLERRMLSLCRRHRLPEPSVNSLIEDPAGVAATVRTLLAS